jgi:hypothetical protein
LKRVPLEPLAAAAPRVTLLQLLASNHASTAQAAVEVFARIAATASVDDISTILTLLHHPRAQVREKALAVAQRSAPALGCKQMALVLEMVKPTRPTGDRLHGFQILRHASPEVLAAAAGDIVTACLDTNPVHATVRAAAVRALSGSSEALEAALPGIESLAVAEEEDVRWSFFTALRALRSEAFDALIVTRLLARAVEDPSEAVVEAALESWTRGGEAVEVGKPPCATAHTDIREVTIALQPTDKGCYAIDLATARFAEAVVGRTTFVDSTTGAPVAVAVFDRGHLHMQSDGEVALAGGVLGVRSLRVSGAGPLSVECAVRAAVGVSLTAAGLTLHAPLTTVTGAIHLECTSPEVDHPLMILQQARSYRGGASVRSAGDVRLYGALQAAEEVIIHARSNVDLFASVAAGDAIHLIAGGGLTLHPDARIIAGATVVLHRPSRAATQEAAWVIHGGIRAGAYVRIQGTLVDLELRGGVEATASVLVEATRVQAWGNARLSASRLVAIRAVDDVTMLRGRVTAQSLITHAGGNVNLAVVRSSPWSIEEKLAVEVSPR